MSTKPGSNIQNHQPVPTLESASANEMMRNAIPMKMFLNDCSSVSFLPRFRPGLQKAPPLVNFLLGRCLRLRHLPGQSL